MGVIEITTGLGLSIDAFVLAAAIGGGRRADDKWLSPKLGTVFAIVAASATTIGWLVSTAIDEHAVISLDLVSGLAVYAIGFLWAVQMVDGSPNEVSSWQLAPTVSIISILVAAAISNVDALIAGSLFGCQGKPFFELAIAVGLCSGGAAALGSNMGSKLSSSAHPWFDSVGGFALMGLGTFAVYF